MTLQEKVQRILMIQNEAKSLQDEIKEEFGLTYSYITPSTIAVEIEPIKLHYNIDYKNLSIERTIDDEFPEEYDYYPVEEKLREILNTILGEENQ